MRVYLHKSGLMMCGVPCQNNLNPKPYVYLHIYEWDLDKGGLIMCCMPCQNDILTGIWPRIPLYVV